MKCCDWHIWWNNCYPRLARHSFGPPLPADEHAEHLPRAMQRWAVSTKVKIWI